MKKTALKGRIRRHKKVRARVFGTSARPRLSVYRSNKGLFVQIIDDQKGRTLMGLSDRKLKGSVKGKSKMERAQNLGLEVARLAREQKIKKVVLDRGGYKYQGRVKALAEGGREGGLEF